MCEEEEEEEGGSRNEGGEAGEHVADYSGTPIEDRGTSPGTPSLDREAREARVVEGYGDHQDSLRLPATPHDRPRPSWQWGGPVAGARGC